jgi:hypothetical protein
VDFQDGLFGRNAAWLLPVGLRMALNETGRELF